MLGETPNHLPWRLEVRRARRPRRAARRAPSAGDHGRASMRSSGKPSPPGIAGLGEQLARPLGVVGAAPAPSPWPGMTGGTAPPRPAARSTPGRARHERRAVDRVRDRPAHALVVHRLVADVEAEEGRRERRRALGDRVGGGGRRVAHELQVVAAGEPLVERRLARCARGTRCAPRRRCPRPRASAGSRSAARPSRPPRRARTARCRRATRAGARRPRPRRRGGAATDTTSARRARRGSSCAARAGAPRASSRRAPRPTRCRPAGTP